MFSKSHGLWRSCRVPAVPQASDVSFAEWTQQMNNSFTCTLSLTVVLATSHPTTKMPQLRCTLKDSYTSQ
eukprot:5627345-Pyramimonas_sp.AAC.1